MKAIYLSAAALTGLLVASVGHARASTFEIDFSGAGVSGMVDLEYGAATDANFPNGFEITGVSGTFSDSNNGLNIVNADIQSLIPIAPSPPNDPANNPPADFGFYTSVNQLLTYDNLIFPAGSTVTAPDYAIDGAPLDFYGILFSIGNGMVVNLWSNGIIGTDPQYGVKVATHNEDSTLNVVLDSVSAVPEPASMTVLGVGAIGLMLRRRRTAVTTA